MARVRIVRGRASITNRNVKHYVHLSIPYISLLLSTLAILKAYNVIL